MLAPSTPYNGIILVTGPTGGASDAKGAVGVQVLAKRDGFGDFKIECEIFGHLLGSTFAMLKPGGAGGAMGVNNTLPQIIQSYITTISCESNLPRKINSPSEIIDRSTHSVFWMRFAVMPQKI
jgi:hypothetical protein